MLLANPAISFPSPLQLYLLELKRISPRSIWYLIIASSFVFSFAFWLKSYNKRNSNQNNKIQFSLITQVKVKKINNIQYWQKCRRRSTLPHWQEWDKMVPFVGEHLITVPNILSMLFLWPGNPTSRDLFYTHCKDVYIKIVIVEYLLKWETENKFKCQHQ